MLAHRRRRGRLLAPAGASRYAGRSSTPVAPASLIADQVTYDRDTRILSATGNVEVLYQGRVLRADRIIYDEAATRSAPRASSSSPTRPAAC